MSVARKFPQNQATKSCWTCRQRKIGCDKSLPLCQNCVRTKRLCGGYNIKLQWPESGDGRRPVLAWESESSQYIRSGSAQQSGDYHFLNTTYEDFLLCIPSDSYLFDQKTFSLHGHQPSPSRSLPFGYETSLTKKDGRFLSYYHHVVSRMITSIDDGLNGFRTVLLPNALSSQSLASQSLRQAILALSAFHSSGHEQAIPYKISAMRLLHRSIHSNEDGRVAQIAACMMLCVGDVFDSADGSWYTHLTAAKILRNNLATPAQKNGFIDSWLAYHDVLANFSCPGPKRVSSGPIKLPSQGDDKDIIIGSLGCSLQVLQCIACINSLSNLLSQNDTKELPAEYTSYPDILLEMITSLRQRHPVVEDIETGVLDAKRILQTAELYRTATEIYLRRSVMSTPSQSFEVQQLVNFTLDTIENLGICTSPWPVFMAACEVIHDEQRIRVLRALDRMRVERRIGNIEIMRGIIEGFWKKQDLGNTDVDWREVADLQGHVPSFI